MKILPGQKSWRFHRKGFAKNSTKGKYSRSKSQNDAGYESPRGSDSLEGKENVSVSNNGTFLSHEGFLESTRSPPIKPPRKDHVFKLEFEICGDETLGLILGNTQDNTCTPNSCSIDSVTSRLTITPDIDIDDSLDEMSYKTISPIKVVNIMHGSLVHADGGIQIYDEIIDINCRPVQGESIACARYFVIVMTH